VSHWNSLVDLLQGRALQTPQSLAFTFIIKNEENKLTYQSLHEEACAIAVAIRNQGLRKGDRALLIYPPGVDLIKALFGCFYAGVIAVPVFPPVNKSLVDKTHRILQNAKPKLTLMMHENREKFGIAYEKTPTLATDIVDLGRANEWENDSLAQDLAFLQYTSGSTSYPKGVMISHGNLLDNLQRIYDAFGMNDKSIMVGWLPPYHDMGLIGNILSPLYGGYPVVLMTPFSFLQNPLAWLQIIGKYKATISGSPNFAYDYCVRRIKEEKKEGLNLSSWEVAFNGAEPLHEGTMERFYQAFKDYGFRKESFYPCYGLAEATLLVSSGIPNTPYQKVRVAKEHFQNHRVHFLKTASPKSHVLISSGTLRQKVKIVDPDTLHACAPDVVGEIWVNSPSVASGYWHLREETEQIFKGRIHEPTNPDNFLRTGDLGFIHEDDLYVTGRIKDLIILYGKNHYPQDIEYTINHSPVHAQLGSCAAYVNSVDGEYRLTVVCELKNRDLEDSDNVFTSIFELVYQEHQLEIHHIVLVPLKSIPKTTSGKVCRNFCKAHLADNTMTVIDRWDLTDNKDS